MMAGQRLIDVLISVLIEHAPRKETHILTVKPHARASSIASTGIGGTHHIASTLSTAAKSQTGRRFKSSIVVVG